VKVAVNGVTQFSGTTTNDFTNPVTYVVTAADGTTQIYTVTINFTNNLWTWVSGTNAFLPRGTYGTKGIGSVNNIPGGRVESILQLISNNVWLFGGNGYGTSASAGNINDLWQYNPSNNQWTWMGGPNIINQRGTYGTQGTGSTSNIPGARSIGVSWADSSGNFWLFGGSGFGVSGPPGRLNDLWKYSTSGASAGQWTWVSGSNTTNAFAVYGSQGTGSSSNTPGARLGAISWTDSNGNFWLFGGDGFVASGGAGSLNDLWKYTPSNNQWTWVSGTNLTNQLGIYGTQGIASPGNMPGGRKLSQHWVDSSGNLWLFGGFGFGASGGSSFLNDLWKYTPSTNAWTWVGGTNLLNQVGIYGTQGIGSTSNIPGARYEGMSWVDSSGNFWLFGGLAVASTIPLNDDVINDLWIYAPSTNKWTWVSGANVISQIGNYGTLGVGATTNVPGARQASSVGWTDGVGNLWVFGGAGYGTSSLTQSLNDLWQYHY
ncbi:MAG TPA: kelch repeat-containing protein, partial [Aquella sp.]|nr:kelch repeat-containing protein [Aquella sp.]